MHLAKMSSVSVLPGKWLSTNLAAKLLGYSTFVLQMSAEGSLMLILSTTIIWTN